MSGLKGIFYGYMAQPTAAKGTLPPAGELAFYVDSTTNHFSMIDSSGTVTDLTDQSFSADFSFAEGVDMTFGTSAGTKIGTASGQLLSFYGATPVNKGDALTTITSSATYTVSGAADAAFSIVTSAAGGTFGLADVAEFQGLLNTVVNNQTRLSDLESRMQDVGLIN